MDTDATLTRRYASRSWPIASGAARGAAFSIASPGNAEGGGTSLTHTIEIPFVFTNIVLWALISKLPEAYALAETVARRGSFARRAPEYPSAAEGRITAARRHPLFNNGFGGAIPDAAPRDERQLNLR